MIHTAAGVVCAAGRAQRALQRKRGQHVPDAREEVEGGRESTCLSNHVFLFLDHSLDYSHLPGGPLRISHEVTSTVPEVRGQKVGSVCAYIY